MKRPEASIEWPLRDNDHIPWSTLLRRERNIKSEFSACPEAKIVVASIYDFYKTNLRTDLVYVWNETEKRLEHLQSIMRGNS